jgi:hypothetical protein
MNETQAAAVTECDGVKTLGGAGRVRSEIVVLWFIA